MLTCYHGNYPCGQESDKLADDDLFRYLGEIKKGAILSRKLKSIPGDQLYLVIIIF